MQAQQLPVWFFLLVPVLFFVLLWLGVSILAGYVSGWRQLARRFRAPGDFRGPTWSYQTAITRFGKYGGCVTFGSNPEGVYLSMLFLFRPFAPPLLIPWSEISVRKSANRFFGTSLTLMFGKEEQIPFTVHDDLGQRLRQAAGPYWPA